MSPLHHQLGSIDDFLCAIHCCQALSGCSLQSTGLQFARRDVRLHSIGVCVLSHHCPLQRFHYVYRFGFRDGKRRVVPGLEDGPRLLCVDDVLLLVQLEEQVLQLVLNCEVDAVNEL